MLCQSGDAKRKGKQVGRKSGIEVDDASHCLSKCDATSKCNIATYSEDEQLCKLFRGKRRPITKKSVRCDKRVSSWVVYAKVIVEVPPDTDIDLELSEEEEEDVQCYLWTQILIDMIQNAEDSSGEHTNSLPVAGTVIPAESMNLLPSEQMTLTKWEESGFLERC